VGKSHHHRYGKSQESLHFLLFHFFLTVLNKAKGMPWILRKRSTLKKPTFQQIDIVVVRKGRQYFIRDQIECPLAAQ
jgi:hypothetical protein